jgi:Ca2+-binding RTX toxin-like protein
VFDDFQMYKQQGLADGMLLGDTWNIVYLGYGFGNIAGVDTVGMIQDVVAGVPVLQLPSTTAIESKAWLNEVYGSRKGDKLVGTSENDLIDGGSGGDSMRGGLGDDSYRVDSLQDKIIEKSGEGVDTVFVSLSRYTAPLSVENLTSTNVAGSQLVGNELDNILKGSSGSDILDGLAGADILFGGGGKDIFVLRAGEANGDRIMDFQSGDQIKLVGFGEDALLVGDAQGNWAVHWDGGNEVFQVLGWGTLSSQVDYVFW